SGSWPQPREKSAPPARDDARVARIEPRNVHPPAPGMHGTPHSRLRSVPASHLEPGPRVVDVHRRRDAPHRGGGSPPEAFNIATIIAHGGTWIELGFDGTPTAVSLALDGPPRTSSRAWPTSPSNRSRWTDRIPTGEPPHAPQGQPRDAELPDLRPPVALVDVPRARMGGLEIAREAVA